MKTCLWWTLWNLTHMSCICIGIFWIIVASDRPCGQSHWPLDELSKCNTTARGWITMQHPDWIDKWHLSRQLRSARPEKVDSSDLFHKHTSVPASHSIPHARFYCVTETSKLKQYAFGFSRDTSFIEIYKTVTRLTNKRS